MAADYAALKASVEFYSDRTDTETTAYDRMLRLACEKLNRRLRPIETLTTLTLTGADFPYTDSTNAFMEIDSIYVTRSSSVNRLDYVPVAKLKAIQANSSGSPPLYFTTVGTKLLIGPEPASTDSIEVVYYARQDDTLGDAETNTFITYYESLMLNLMLAELYKSLHDSTRAAEYETIANATIEEVNLATWQRKYPARLTVKNA